MTLLAVHGVHLPAGLDSELVPDAALVDLFHQYRTRPVEVQAQRPFADDDLPQGVVREGEDDHQLRLRVEALDLRGEGEGGAGAAGGGGGGGG
eukprot:CAMPEP_0115646474 /NCGR_PEP_ID=MMETSP0272-20121206/38948_1 /TAXON_ID=71861 /ORGANISM="Scrippsiella trochoidea, Strain CCMP3099" /LENGTH=92 /DNA_ID=CAMNT_0003084001 /DNA_START=96 /DNA_END=371 /DNA_ORIENTATION=-